MELENLISKKLAALPPIERKRSVMGAGYRIGYLSTREESGRMSRVYKCWQNLISICYGIKRLSRFPAHIDSHVCADWLCFETFAKWHVENYRDGYVLRKDSIAEDNKVFCPELCRYVPKGWTGFWLD